MDKDQYYLDEVYAKGLNREDTIEKQIRKTVDAYSEGEWDKFEYSIKALIALLPTQIRIKFKPLQHDTTKEGIEDHYKQFIKIQETLEQETNMIFKKRYIKTYQ